PGWTMPEALVFVIETSAVVGGPTTATVVVAVAELLAVEVSADAVAADAVFVMIVPPATLAPTVTTSVKVALPPAASDGFVADAVPVAPTAGVDGVQPAGTANDANVVLGGTTSVNEILAAAAVPLFVTVIV